MEGWESFGLRLSDGDQPMDDGANLEPHVQEFRFDDGGMKGLAAALCWCGLFYFVSNLDDSVVCHGGVKELAMSLLSVPTYYKRPGQDPAHAMIGRIIRQNVQAKKMAVSSFEWSQILGKMAMEDKEGEKITVQEAIEIYNGNPKWSPMEAVVGQRTIFCSDKSHYFSEKQAKEAGFVHDPDCNRSGNLDEIEDVD